ncbi:aminotransferase class V-fold PLP-dependent enzyme [Mycoplasma tauri]|uniref:Aminotransferase class V-fold PLP-dependent enzyme n=1 Tax=Mycoplasma tauri TaxID=547987 RepID=A0A953NE42_9MOLU|nr:aminotransferase class V-fold PLP-dependent enzyme [Mycoplasma tauri]MBZ4195278.1 aminotransferase class V-fold PLP-dependent enzyme [Mycoplasma tauri]MBZ4204328.1 aminotransferase class V-fold PLP-dependent enzyme [Mycoplasma tauri]MBZ4212855.1 aminotransferase class V-fold PLP-dependent enzyme [Mycoplasma tauri]MBZ4218361.1 aminotransferase class V-fold PLP-dependent enzyme [Mycoplasma tauri]MBZ4226594.1 aminotransferase class V-fold PLP-dependent enzyme [Mycoplasma tauri]
MENLKKYFTLSNKITYLDNAALTLKPQSSIEALNNFYTNYSISSRTRDTPIGIKVNEEISSLRKNIANLINSKPEEVIFTSGATDSINKCAAMLKKILKKDHELLLSAYNHSSNITPWIKLADELNVTIKIVDDNLIDSINSKTKIIAFSQLSNNYNIKYDMEKIYKKANEIGAIVINDAAQAIVYEPVNFYNSHIVVFSSNKFYGPTGFGALIIKENLLKHLKPSTFGGGSTLSIDSNNNCYFQNGIEAFEPGTPNLSAIFMFNESLNFFKNKIGYDLTKKKIEKLSSYAYEKLSKLENIELYTSKNSHIILFNVKGINAQDVAHYLGTKNIYVRAGLFCALYLKNIKSVNSYVRISLAVYNDEEDIDNLVKELEKGGDFLVL